MRLLVVGADGGVGRHVVEQGLGHGHDIVAFAPSGRAETAHERLHAVTGSLADRDAIAAAAEGAEAVLVAVASAADAPGRDGRLFSASMAAVVSAMKLVRARRLVALSAAGAGESRDGTPLAYRLKIASVWRDSFADIERMEEVVLFSGLDWTVVRPAPLTDGPLTGLYRVRDNVLPERGKSVSSADVAALMLKALSSDRYVNRIIAVAD